MRTGKRALAGVAAGALAAGLIPFALVATATSANAATATATVSPVRPTGTGGSALNIPAATASWTGTGNLAGATVDLVTAPTAGAVMTFAGTGADDTVTLNQDGTLAGNAVTTADDTSITLNVDTAGTYSGTIADGTDTVSFSFTTRGTPASMTLTPASQTVLVGAPATLTVTLLDSNGNRTQPSSVDTVALSDNSDDTVSPTLLVDDSLATGVATVTLTTTGNAAGTTTVTATPQGTLPAGGVTAQSATVTKSGTVNSGAAKSIKVTAPTTAISTPANTDDTVVRTVAVPLGTSSMTVTVDDTSGNPAGSTVRLSLLPSAGTVNGSSTVQYVDLVTDSNRQATLALSLGGAAVTAGQTVTIQQVNVTNAQVGGSNVVITQTQSTVTAATITVSPDDSNVAAIGATTNVTVTVKDTFGNPQAGWIVDALRGATVGTGTFLSTGTTNAEGVATVSVTSAAGAVNNTVEQYSFEATPPVGPAVPVNNRLQITYTTSGGVSGLSVLANPATAPTSPVLDTTTTITTAPYINVVSSGVANTTTTGTFNTTTDVVTAGNSGNRAAFTPTATPLNNVTVSVSTGAFVTTSTSAAWNAGESSVTVSSGTAVYVFATTVGTYNVTFSSGGKTVVIPVKVGNNPTDAYNIAISPEAQELAPSAFGTATVTVTDIFGNPVAGTSDDTGGVTVTATGEVRLGGLMASQAVNTGADGTATVSLIAGNAGEGMLTIAPTNGTNASNAPAYRPNFTPPTGAPAPVLSGAAEVTVTAGPTPQTIMIIDGYRDGQRIEAFGNTTGFDMGALLSPWIRFPGQVGFTQGTAEILVDDEGYWNWGRKTGKRTAVQIRSLEDPSIRSNTVIIAAR